MADRLGSGVTPAPIRGPAEAQRSDEDLMAAIIGGDRSAFPRLVERHRATLLGLFHRILGGDREIAEDLVQETFLRLLQQHSFSPGRPFKPWLYRLAANLAIDHRRAEARRPRSSGEVGLGEIPDPRQGPDQHIENAAELSRIITALAQLPEGYRLALTLRYFDDLTLNQIAQALNVPIGTVKSRLTVGTRRLRHLLGQPDEVTHT